MFVPVATDLNDASCTLYVTRRSEAHAISGTRTTANTATRAGLISWSPPGGGCPPAGCPRPDTPACACLSIKKVSSPHAGQPGQDTERAQQARVLRAGVGRREAPVGERLLHDDAEPGVVRSGKRGGERGLEAVEGRLHDVEDGLTVDACRPRQREGARRGGTGEREPDGAVGAGTPALHQGAQQGGVFEASRLRRPAVDLAEA